MMTSRGFTLLECMVCLAIISLLLAVGVPSWREFSRDAEVSATTANYLHAFNSGRYAAVAARRAVSICHLERMSCNGRWDRHLTVFYDDDRDGRLAATRDLIDEVDTRTAHPVTVTLKAFGRTRYISLRSSGFYRQNGTFRICPQQGRRGRAIVINVVGRARTENITCP